MFPKVFSLRNSTNSIGFSASRGVAWLLGEVVLTRAVQACTQVALAYLLSPSDFGQVGLAYTVITIVTAFFSFGFEDVVLQRHSALRLWTGTVFWVSATLGMLGFLTALAVAPFAAWLYQTPKLTGIIYIAALMIPI